MAEDLTIQVLRQIQDELGQVRQKLAEHDRRFEALQQNMDARFERLQAQMDSRFDAVDREFSDLIGATSKGIGYATYANTRHESVQRQFVDIELTLKDPRARLTKLEERV